MSVVMRTTTEIQIPGTDVWFEPEGQAPERHEDLHVRELGIQVGLDIEDRPKWQVSWLVRDEDYEYEWDDLNTDPNNWSNGVFIQASHSWVDRVLTLRSIVGDDKVFPVEVYEHGMVSYSLRGESNYPDRGWDVRTAGYIAAPPDVINPREWAAVLLKDYTSVVNGDVWGIVSNTVTVSGRVVDEHSEWGIISREVAEQEMRWG